ncbi:outer membrane porin, OprD family [Pseudomonas gingeri]|nr:outer membrane porin, OprD family [Pseudomonas gingeri]NWD69502.1 outer membrane porin, OprD family [Pseudomonas gingeri]NWD75888.1 outer membrane porin, OprD family [Pseudomonas gingeri]
MVNFTQIGDFAEAWERSWQAGYDYEQMGIPWLTFMSRYITDDNM